jgi:hypothetical protein
MSVANKTVANCQFCLYSRDGEERQPMRHMSLNKLMAMDDIFSLPEDSGCESSYVEVARWSHDRERWELFAFEKMMDVSILDEEGEPIDMDDRQKAEHVSAMINAGRCDKVSWIGSLPRWEG